MPLLDSTVTLITGAKGGLGTSVTRAFLDAGATVIGISRSIEAADFSHPAFTAMPASLSTAAGTQQVVAAVIERFSRIDTLVHVMGGFAGGARVDETPDAVFENMLDVNYRAAFFMVRAVLPHMRKQGSGRILAVASRQGVEPSAMVGAYSASKAALVSLVRTVALENKDQGISANTVLPGTMDTPANRAAMPNADRSQWVEPAQVAALLVHLASEAAAQITGAAIPVYGSQV
jgi:NAD(P)-dependent dehydrogenase (short-subunit alcohol dehydrogenase family)